MTPEPNRQQEIIKRSLLEIRDLKGKLQAAERTLHEPIAIVGIGCRFPAGADTPDSYWQLLKNGVDATREVPADRWDVDGYYDPNPDALGKMYTQRGGFLDRVDLFDPLFFNIPPREAVSMDPQHRLFVEVVWEALENAGIAPDSLANSKTGVFAGITAYDYAQLISLSRDPSLLDAYASTGNPLNFVSGRVSYLLGLQGPSMALDTACSSSLVSVHLACQNLRLGVIDMALAGGVNMVLSPETMVTLSKAKMLAADGRCKTFDASADGYARGEGGGVVVLKRVSDALRDGDNIWAVIRGSAVNQDGPSSGLTVPNGQAQQLVMREALALAGLNPHDVSYVDAHGTGTSLGDPIELRALEAVYGAGRSSENPLIVGSAKTNLGHLEAAAGIAGLIKIALTVHHGQIAPHLNLEHPNPNVAWDKLHIHVPTQGMPFPTHAASRIAAVSSFGASGTNGHIIVEAAPQRPIEQKPQRPLHVVTLSTKHPEDLRVLAERIVAELNAQPNASLADVATTLNSGRASMPYRAAIRAESLVGLKRTLTDYVANGASVNLLGGHARANQRPKIALLHTGKIGGGMGTALYATVAAFRAWVDQACAAMGVPANPIPAFALEFALGQLWGALGVTPSAVAGTGRGAIAAAVTAGAISLEEGAALAAARDAAEYAAVVDGLIPRAPRYPLYSSDGQALTAAMLDADYWRSLDDAIPLTLGGLVTAGNRVFIALGDTDIVPLHYGQGFSEGVASGELVTLESLAPDNDWNALLPAAAHLFTLGVNIRWKLLDQPFAAGIVRLPNSPYRRERFWIDAPKPALQSTSGFSHTAGERHPLLGERLSSPLVMYENTFHRHTTALVEQHVIYNMPVMPGTVWIEMGIQAIMARTGETDIRTFSLEKFTVRQPMIFNEGSQYRVQSVYTPEDAHSGALQVFSYDADGQSWHMNADMRVRLNVDDLRPSVDRAPDPQAALARMTDHYSAEAFYADVWHPKFYLGESFRCVKEVWRRDGEALARVFVPVSNPADMIHPEVLTLDACVQLMIAALPPAQRLGDVYVGLGQAFTRMYQPFPPEVWALVILDEHSGRGNTISANILIFDDNGAMVGEFGSVSFSRATADSLQRMAHAQASTATKSSGFGREQVLAAAPDQRPLVLQTYLISTTAQIMGTTADRLDAGQPILDLVDSLMSVELKNQIETDLGVDLPVADLLNGQSIADLAAGMSAIHFANGGGSPVKVARAQSGGLNVQQMQALAVLPEDIRPSRAYTPKAPKAVFLTGATGFVGAYLLAELLNQTDADVICLVRGLDEDDALDRLQRNLERYELWKPRHAARIVPLLGDLAEPNFGLTDEQFSALALTADLIWHNGALVKWTYPYMALAKANVDGTREILRLACMGGATPVQFVSTVGVFSSADFAGDAVYENEPIQNAGVLHVGYAQSKWVGEALVREAGARGLPVTLYRINTGGDSRTGTYNPNDYLPLLLNGCVELGSAPYDLDLTVQAAPIDYVGRAMVALSLMPTSIGETFHMVNMGGRTWSEMVAFMQSEGYPVQTVSYGEWQAAIEARSKVEPTFALAGLSPLFSDMFAAETRLPIYADTHAAALLAPLGITCPPLDADLLRLYFTGLFRAATSSEG